MRVYAKTNKVIVKDVNIVTRHKKPMAQGETGTIDKQVIATATARYLRCELSGRPGVPGAHVASSGGHPRARAWHGGRNTNSSEICMTLGRSWYKPWTA